MLLARSLLAGSVALMVGWAVLVGVVFNDPSLLRDRGAGDAVTASETLAAAIEEINRLRDELVALQPPADGEAPNVAAAAPAPPTAAGAPPKVGPLPVDPLPVDVVAGTSLGAGEPPAPDDFLDVDPPRMHRVAIGDSASSIAQRYGITVEELTAFNGLRDPGLLRLGTLLLIP